MSTFTIKEEFLLNDQPFKILSGAVHYFRLVPEHWRRTLHNLKAMGCNTVETYVPWNLHEPQENVYQFSDELDLVAFIKLAQELDLYVILRPSHYICAEWEFGGLPAWLLNYPGMKVRTTQPLFIEKVTRYYEHLLPLVTPLQIDQGGPILMMQIENEYGSFNMDKDYLRMIKQIMLENGVTVPLFTSDGAWYQCLEAGSLIEEGVLPTGNFGSRSTEHLDNLEQFFVHHKKKYPLMCMEFWDGWFNRWGEPIIKRDPVELAQETQTLVNRASLNFYMFIGGTNFGFMNSASNRKTTDLPQVTSYDYDAPLTEWGEPTKKYYLLREVLLPFSPESAQLTPIVPIQQAYGLAQLINSVSLFNTLEYIAQPVMHDQTLTMEELNSPYGYLLYRTTVDTQYTSSLKMRIIDGLDRMQIYQDQQHIVTQYQHEIGDDIMLDVDKSQYIIDILCENMGRASYGARLWSPTQRKGIRSGVMFDLHFHKNWQHYALNLENIDHIDFSGETQEGVPNFYQYHIYIDDIPQNDTFIDCRQLGKGVILVNGFNIGRFNCMGPIAYLFVPYSLLKQGLNEIIVFDTDKMAPDTLALVDQPIYIDLKEGEK